VAERLLLVGMMGAGKSTVGALVARRLGWSFMDTDEEVARSTGQAVSELFGSVGEQVFREEEARALIAAVAGTSTVVVSVGGGAVLDPSNRAILRRSGLVVWLRARLETLAERVGDGTGRPLLAGFGSTSVAGTPLQALVRLEVERNPLYFEVADAVVDVDGVSAEELAECVAELVERAAGASKLPEGGART